MRFRIDWQTQIGLTHLSKQGIDLAEVFDFVAPQFDAVGVVVISREDLDDVAAHAEGSALEAVIVALIQDFDQSRNDLLARYFLSLLEHQQHSVIRFRRTQTVNATDAGDDHAVAPFEQRSRGGETKLVELVVDGGLFFNVNVAGRHVGFGLVVIVIADEILDGVGGEKCFEFVIELRGERFVVGQHQGWAASLFDDLSHGVGLARACDAEQHLRLLVRLHARHQFLDRGRLVALRLVLRDDLERDAAFALLRA